MTVRLVRLLERRGRDVGPIAAAAHTTREEVSDPSARVPYPIADAFLEACADELGAGGLSLALAAVFDDETYDAAGLVLASGPTFAEGLRRAFVYQRLWGDGERFTFRRADGASGSVRFRHLGPSPLAGAILAELALLETAAAARALVSPDARPRAVTFAHAPFGDPSPLAAVFGEIPSFGAKETEIVFDGAVLDAPVRMPESAVARVFDLLAQRAVSALPETVSLAERVRALCRSSPGAYALDVGDVARRLHVSARTLQRRLRAEGTSWAEIVDDLRRAHARELQLRGAADKEIAFLLGFADPSALARARRRWTARRC